MCAGATGSPPDGGLFIFKGLSAEDIEAFVKVGGGGEGGHTHVGCAQNTTTAMVGSACKCTRCCVKLPRSSCASLLPLFQADPYFQNGLITGYKISPYSVAVGSP